MSDNTTPKANVSVGLNRYRGMIISIGFFVVLLAALLIYANNISSEIEEDSIQSYVTSEMANSYGEMLENIQLLQLNTHQDPQSPVVQGALKKRKTSSRARCKPPLKVATTLLLMANTIWWTLPIKGLKRN